MIIAGIYLLGSTLWAMDQHPQLAAAQPGAALSWFSLWLFVVIAWWCAGNNRRVGIVLSLAFASLVISLLMGFDWRQWHAILIEARRSGIGFTAAAAGLYTATALLGWLLLARPWALDQKSRLTSSLAFVGWVAIMLWLLQIIAIAQSRTTWLALLLVGLSLAAFAGYNYRGAIKTLSQGQVFKIIIGVSIIAVCLLGFLFINDELIVRRFRVFKKIALAGWADMPLASIGVRLSLDHYGFQKLLERPLLGWGPGTAVTREFATADGFSALAKQPDLHNSFLVLLVRLGLIGGLIYLAGAVHLGRRVWQTYRRHAISHRMFLFLLGAAGLTFLASLMNFRWIHIDFRFFWLILAGVAFSYALAKRPMRLPAD
ncbi:MAG: O-antigen ligase family protein [Nitrococcus mobilis]|nr:O-antigen ligase family protein [Nitrococcus mobilis]